MIADPLIGQVLEERYQVERPHTCRLSLQGLERLGGSPARPVSRP